MSDCRVIVDGETIEVAAGVTVAAAVALAGTRRFRTSPAGFARAPVCGMGICFECRVQIDGRAGVRSCMVPCVDGMVVRTTHA